MKETLLSVIIPVYNTEKYLERCINSIIAQTYRNLEIILVDDGSTDKSGELCDIYAEKDLRITVLHQENRGQNAARKAGIDIAKGTYITFADSDDWLDIDMYESAFSAMQGKDYDLICFDHYVDNNDTCKIVASTVQDGFYEREDILSKIIPCMRWDFREGRSGISDNLWNKFFSKELLKKTMNHIDYAMTVCEDSAIVYPHIMRAQKVLVTHQCGYHYVWRKGSAMHSFTVETFEKILRVQKYMQAELLRLKEEYQDITARIIEQVEEQFDQAIGRIIGNIVREVYHISIVPRWCVPYACIPKNSKIALYGAGDVGRAYKYKLYGDPSYEVVTWVDKNHKAMIGVEASEHLLETEYDIVLIAVESERMANQIRTGLLTMGIAEDKIVWQKPQPMPFMKWVNES